MKVPFVLLLAGLSVLSFASGRSLQQTPVQAPAPAGDAIVSIINPSGIATAAVPVVDRSNLKVSPSDLTVVKPDGLVQAVLSLAEGNSTIGIQPSATSTGFITISQPNGPSTQVSLEPRPTSAAAPAPGVPGEVSSDLALMPKFYDWGGSFSGSFTSSYSSVTVDASKSAGTVSVDVRSSFSC
ncbi:hypothetical protein WJX75_008721 [Coccomyxa subellipsoidea]|uniref:Uncharacterized protein n=1 Tax=Coccomyxa subellipsoidea TaxID=248742 RepID=A0ABR2Z4Y3_9CHLO